MLEEAAQFFLKLPHIRVLQVEHSATDYLITIESTLDHALCHKCGRKITTFACYDDWITLQHLPMCGQKVLLRLRPKRFRCLFCSDRPKTTQELPWYRPRSPFTKALEQHLLVQCVHSTVTDVSIKEQVGYDAIEGVIDHYISTKVDWSMFHSLEQIGIDEIALKKHHRLYAVVITSRQADGTVQLLAVLPDRQAKTVKTFFTHIPYRLRRTVTNVCCDMYEPYLQAIEAVFGADVIVIDRFHVAKLYRAAADTLRKRELARLKRERSPETYALLKGVMWFFRRRWRDLTPSEQDVLECLFAAAPNLRQAYTLREALTDLFQTPLTKSEAQAQFRTWMEQVRASGLTCFDTFLKTLEAHFDGITNYFRDRYSSGFVEGLNTKLKVLKRRCYGLTNFAHLFQRIVLDLEGVAAFRPTLPATK